MEGWISLHRRFIDWEWFSDEKMVKLFIYFLLKANRKDGIWRGININRGQLITGLNTLSKDTNITKQSLRTCLTRFKKTGEINIESTNKYSIITICNYDTYQSNNKPTNTQTNNQLTHNQHSTNTQSTTNNTSNTNNTLNTEIKDYKKTLLSEITSDEFNLKEEYLEIAKSFQELFIKNQNDVGIKNSTLKKAKGTWVDDIRLIIESDGKTVDQCREVWNFIKTNDFWKSNILSTNKLRKQFDTLLMQANNGTEKKSNNTTGKLLNRMENIITKPD